MSQSIGSSQIPNYRLIVGLLLVGFFIGHSSLFRLVDFNECIAINFVVFKGRVSLNDLEITSRIPFPAFQIFEMNISQHFTAFDKVCRVRLHCLKNAHCFFYII